jgi:hypothetical protein
MRMYAFASMAGAFGMGIEAENADEQTKSRATKSESERCIRKDLLESMDEACESRGF